MLAQPPARHLRSIAETAPPREPGRTSAVQSVLLPEQKAEWAVSCCSECHSCDCQECRADEYSLFHLSVSIGPRAELSTILTPPHRHAALHPVRRRKHAPQEGSAALFWGWSPRAVASEPPVSPENENAHNDLKRDAGNGLRGAPTIAAQQTFAALRQHRFPAKPRPQSASTLVTAQPSLAGAGVSTEICCGATPGSVAIGNVSKSLGHSPFAAKLNGPHACALLRCRPPGRGLLTRRTSAPSK